MKSEKKEKLGQLAKILQSGTFRGSATLQTFLTYVVHAALENGGSEVKEYTIASEVFGKSSYDSRIDSTVRVQASRLRIKLEEYYRNGGTEDKWLIELPKGHYVPVFRRKGEPTPVIEPPRIDTPAIPAVTTAALPSTQSERRPRRLNWPAFAMAAFALAALTLALSYRSDSLRVQSWLFRSYFSPADVEDFSLLWEDFLARGRPVVIVYSSTLLKESDTLATESIPSNRALNPVRSEVKTAILPEFERDTAFLNHYAGIGEVMGVASLSRAFTRINKGFRIKRSRLLAWDDMKTENLVLLGPLQEINFLEKLPQRRSFDVQVDSANNSVRIVNLGPHAGESKVYSSRRLQSGEGGDSETTVLQDYALVSLVRGLGENNFLMILAGTTTFGTQAAAEYVSNPTSARELIMKLRGGNKTAPRFFEAVLSVHVRDGVPVQTTYATHHPIS